MTIESTAYHEAAHAVVAHSLRAALRYLQLERERCRPEDVAWRGNVCVDYASLSGETCRRIAFAGLFAGTKRRATTESVHNCALEFDASVVSDLTHKILQYDPDDERKEVTGEMRVRCGEHRIKTDINPDDIECDVAQLLDRKVNLELNSIQSDLEWVRCWVNDPANWQSVEAVVNAILSRRPEELDEPDDVLLRIRIEGDEIVQLIESARS